MERLNKFSEYCFNKYPSYIDAGFGKHTQHAELLKLVDKKACKRTKLGESVEGKEIYYIKLGKGSTKILAWSQMHGDESTATGALLDIVNFLTNKHESTIQQSVDKILDTCTLYFIPMVNPDGAERWQRRNFFGIDINRDALMQLSPEAEILIKACKEIEPDYGFNLHDQGNSYTAGLNNTPATISLLAPPYNKEGSINSSRKKAIECLCAIHGMLQKYIPNSVGKWEDDYEERAFGEYFQSQKVSTILIESGAYPNDPDRKMARKLNFVLLLYSFLGISLKTFDKIDIESYNLIPENKRRLFDVVLRNAEIKSKNGTVNCDIALQRYEKKINNKVELIYKIRDLGDLSNETRFLSAETYNNAKTVLNENNTLTILESDGVPSCTIEFMED